MFVFASIPMMERRLLITRGGYAEYREQTGMLVPRLFGRAAGTERSDPLT
jgi:protein-S-isoprenylcysteine O-methyltransferase Ste14